MRIGVIQLNSSNRVDDNLQSVIENIRQLAAQNCDMIVLPENFAAFGLSTYQDIARQEMPLGQGKLVRALCQLASSLNVWICAGTLPINPVSSPQSSKPNATTLLINAQGDIVARYNKVHLFDALVNDVQGRYRESDSYQPGRTLSVIDTAFGRIGLAVCYDLRFADMFLKFRQMGVDIVLVPSAFTHETGKAHWETLIRCRALENGFYIAAANQGGVHFNSRHTWGHSMVVDPWGQVLSQLDQQPGNLVVDIDINRVRQVRNSIPTHWHREKRLSRNLQW